MRDFSLLCIYGTYREDLQSLFLYIYVDFASGDLCGKANLLKLIVYFFDKWNITRNSL